MVTLLLRLLFFARKEHFIAVMVAVAVMVFLPQKFKDDQWTIVSLIAILVLLKEAWVFLWGRYVQK